MDITIHGAGRRLRKSEYALEKLSFRVRGMDCAEEIATLRAELTPLEFVQGIDFDLLHRRVIVQVDGTNASSATICAAIARTGMTAEPWSDDSQDDGSARLNRRIRLALTTLSGALLSLGVLAHAFARGWKAALGAESSPAPWPSKVAYIAALVAAAWFVVPKAWFAARRLRADMNLLMCIAVLGAVALGEWLEAATVAFLFSVALALETWSIGRARDAISALLALSPTQARILDADHAEVLVDPSQVSVGATILVKPGEKFPLDGRITGGRTTVDQAPITGESSPVAKTVGSEVFAGTLNGEGAVEFVAEKAFADSTLSQIAKMVGEAHARRSPSEQWVERFAKIYTPVVVVCAVLLAVVPPVFGGSWSEWFYQALVLLVIACPCALVISTPVSIVASLVAAAKRGVLVKGGLYMEIPSRLVAIALDKTGTLTEGRPRVLQISARSGHSEAELLEVAAAIEVSSTHPLARAIVEHAAAMGIRPRPATGFQMLAGKGASARVDGVEHWLGSHRYLEERGQESEEVHEELEALAAAGASVVVIGKEDHVCGYIALADRLRPSVRKTLSELRSAGVKRIVMLTGDNRGTAAAIAREAGIDEVRAELLPQDKILAIEELAQATGAVAMVGDGVNDAPALARATLGIAMGAAGSDAALETADVALMGDDLSLLPWLIRHSHRTLGIIRQNAWAALLVKGLFLALALSGHATLWAAIAADTGVSLLVVLNALRLVRSQ